MISTVTVERIVINVTSPDLGDADDILLGVVQAVCLTKALIKLMLY
jgi:hypothetical protein